MIFQGKQVHFSKAELKALVAHSSKDETRQHVHCLALIGTKASAVTTDGHRLCLVTSQLVGTFDEVLVPRDAVDRAIKMADAKGSVVIDVETNQIVLRNAETQPTGTITFKPYDDAKFPPYEQILPAFPFDNAASAFVVSARYLASLLLVTEACESRTDGIVCSAPSSEIDPISFVVSGADNEWTVIIMPQRGDHDVIKTANSLTKKRNDTLAHTKRVLAIEAELRATLEAVTRKVHEDAAA